MYLLFFQSVDSAPAPVLQPPTSNLSFHPGYSVQYQVFSCNPKIQNRQLKSTTPSLITSFPFNPIITKYIKKSLESHDIRATSSSGTNLRALLAKTKTTLPPHLTPNVISEISCNDCTATYNGQTNRPVA